MNYLGERTDRREGRSTAMKILEEKGNKET
jgi:hypothetical protein